MLRSNVSSPSRVLLSGVDEPTESGTHMWDETPRSPEQASQPRTRKRVPKACEACRRRKVKCDGKEVCNGCISASFECVYQSAAGEKMMKDHMRAFDTRLQKLEDMFTEMITRFNNQSRPDNTGSSSSTDAVDPMLSRPTPPSTHDPRGDFTTTEESNNIDEDSRIASTLMSLRKAKRQRREHSHCRRVPDSPEQDDRIRAVKRVKHHRHGRQTFADAYGELRADEVGQLRYIGLGSTLRLIDVCPPFRRHLDIGLEKKGYGNSKSVFEYPRGASAILATASASEKPAKTSTSPEQLPPDLLTSKLLDIFYERLYFVFPIISREDLGIQCANFFSTDPSADTSKNTDSRAVLYGILAMAALSFPSEHDLFHNEDLKRYKDINLASVFFEKSVMCGKPTPSTRSQDGVRDANFRSSRSLNNVIAVALQACYMASIGNQAEAWIAVGQAARLGQDIGLHRCPIQLGFKQADQDRRRYAWWCIYSLDRTLSSALGRPFTIRDADCDVELPQDPYAASPDSGASGFHAILRLRQILGGIVDTVAAVRKVKDSRSVGRIPELRAAVVRLNSELQSWSTSDVPQHIKSAEIGSAKVERLIALSGYFSALMLLYRYLVPNPHRPSPLRGSEALAQCARAATNCIQITSKIIEALPLCPDLIFHAQHVFAASMILLHCIRRSDDMKFIEAALKDIEVAQRFLRNLQHIWAGANDLTGLLEEYLEFILNCLERGVDSERCAFHHEEHEVTGLEWREDAADISSIWSQPTPTPIASTMRGLDMSHETQNDPLRNTDPRSSVMPTVARSPSTMTDLWRFMLPQDQICDGDFGRAWNLDSVDRSFDSLLSGGMDATFNFDF